MIFYPLLELSLNRISFAKIDMSTFRDGLLEVKSSQPIDRLNELLRSKIGFGKAQQTMTMPLNLLLFSEGAESIAIGLLLPQLQSQWDISVFEKSLLITCVYLGVALGSFFQSYCDKYGRSIFITWNSVLQCVFGMLSLCATTMPWFICFRFAYGIGIGIVLPLSATYMSEISPNENRIQILVKSRVYWSAGCLFTCLIGWLLLGNHHWRWILFLICLPGVYALILHLQNGKESLRYLWVNKKQEECCELIRQMTQLNERSPISKEQIKRLMAEQAPQKVEGTFVDLFNQKYKWMTVYLMVAWFSVCFVFYGVLLLLPTIIEGNMETSYNFKFVILVVVSGLELICFQSITYFIDHPRIGRKFATYFCFFGTALSSLILIMCDPSSDFLLLVLFALVKVFSTSCFMVLYPYTAEIFETLLRGKAMGLASMSGRVATILLGVIGVSAIQWIDGNGLYLIFVLLSLMSGLLIYKMPYCTLGREMDT